MREGVKDTGIFFVDNKVCAASALGRSGLTGVQSQLELFLHKPLGLLVRIMRPWTRLLQFLAGAAERGEQVRARHR